MGGKPKLWPASIGGRVDQIGIVVRDAEKAMLRYTQALGVRCWYRAESSGEMRVV